MNVSCLINIHDVYNLLSINHNETLKKESFFMLKQIVRLLKSLCVKLRN